jgi:DNA-binding response OmpR family regulator
MLTAKGQRIDLETALECGADLFMTKPFANAEITAASTSTKSPDSAYSADQLPVLSGH